MTTNRVEVEQDGQVARVWLNRADKRNAIDAAMLDELADCFAALERDFDTRVVVLGGRGASFSAGADRHEERLAAGTERERRWRNQAGRRATRAIEECSLPTIARVQGHAAGGGSCLAVSCDFRVTTDTTQWWVPEVELGTPLPWAGTPRLIQEIGMARARRYVMLSERIDGVVATEWGLAHESVPADELDEAMVRWEARLLALPEPAVDMAKSQFRAYARGSALGDHSETDGDMNAVAAQTEQFRSRFGSF